jgi:hypothetical protein
MKKKKKTVNFLDLIPERKCLWEKTETGKICLLVPRFKNTFMKKIALKLGKSETLHITLDPIGTNVWDLIDGNRTVAQIGKEMQKEAPEPIQQLYERLTKFLSQMSHHQFISFKNY